MSQNLQNGLNSTHQPHLAYMQAMTTNEVPERLKTQTNMKQQYATEHLHNSYY